MKKSKQSVMSSSFCKKLLCIGLLLFAGSLIQTNSASAVTLVTLDKWNVIELNATGDIVEVTIDTWAGGTKTAYFVQWMPGPGNTLSAIGLDKFLYNDQKVDTDARRLHGIMRA